jgi:rRNA-processing protein FCF1
MILIDTNALIILILGQIDTRLIDTHKRTSIYEEQDYYDLISVIVDIENLIVLPNVWTEVDNLLNGFNGEHKYQYITEITKIIKSTSEQFLSSLSGVNSESFFNLGLTDSLLLNLAKECELLITSDSGLSDYALAYGIKVFDIVKNRNSRLN